MKEDVIVDIVCNLTEIAVEGWLFEDLLRRDVGILAGILTNCINMVWPRKRYFTFMIRRSNEDQKRGVETYGEGHVATRFSFPNCYIE